MASPVNEVTTAKALGANGSYTLPPGGVICGFLCTTTGTITVVDSANNTMVAPFTCSAATWYPMPFACPIGATVTCSNGAAGTLGVA